LTDDEDLRRVVAEDVKVANVDERIAVGDGRHGVARDHADGRHLHLTDKQPSTVTAQRYGPRGDECCCSEAIAVRRGVSGKVGHCGAGTSEGRDNGGAVGEVHEANAVVVVVCDVQKLAPWINRQADRVGEERCGARPICETKRRTRHASENNDAIRVQINGP
jgi:hypothetical protein